MQKLVFITLLVGLFLFAGCCNFTPSSSQQTGEQSYQTQPQQQQIIPKLPASFCYSLNTENTQSLCLQSAGNVDDDQRIRDYYTYWDAIEQDADVLDSIAERTGEAADAWNSAETTQERNTAYRSYYSAAMDYSTRVEVTGTHLDNFETFLTQNKAFLDSHGINTVSQINWIATFKGNLKDNLNLMQSNLEMMSSSLQLEQQQQEANQALIDTLFRLALGLG